MGFCATFSEEMHFTVKEERSGSWVPWLHEQAEGKCLLAFTTEAAVERFHQAVRPPREVSYTREHGWHRVLGMLRHARSHGATMISVDPGGERATAGDIGSAIRNVEQLIAAHPLHGLIRLRSALLGVRTALLGDPGLGLLAGVETYISAIDQVCAEWHAPKRVLAVVPTVKSFLRAGEDLVLKRDKPGLFVPHVLDEFSIWVEEELARRRASN